MLIINKCAKQYLKNRRRPPGHGIRASTQNKTHMLTKKKRRRPPAEETHAFMLPENYLLEPVHIENRRKLAESGPGLRLRAQTLGIRSCTPN